MAWQESFLGAYDLTRQLPISHMYTGETPLLKTQLQGAIFPFEHNSSQLQPGFCLGMLAAFHLEVMRLPSPFACITLND